METLIPLAQKLYLLGIHPEKGGIVYQSGTAMDYVIVGGLLMEMYLNKNIKFDNKRIVLLSDKSDNDAHRFMLQKMSKAKGPRRISSWINKFYYSLNYIRGEVRDGLVSKRLIKIEDKRFLIFKWKKPFATNKQVLYKLVDEVKESIMRGTSDEESLILLSFVLPAGLLPRLFPDRQERKKARARLKEMLVGNRVSAAVADAISASQAVAASVAISAAAASTSA
ncbi:GOLPH3/VPS74 family protein [Maribellus sediminis]|uniref:GOLPH3/VPS74 family protein n=1 Tax=Maribellus sediminis TaxID=2696285 RepID=UPI0014315A36|nr:GPP34 family phosphoprotein [Maribellus sediminis]